MYCWRHPSQNLWRHSRLLGSSIIFMQRPQRRKPSSRTRIVSELIGRRRARFSRGVLMLIVCVCGRGCACGCAVRLRRRCCEGIVCELRGCPSVEQFHRKSSGSSIVDNTQVAGVHDCSVPPCSWIIQWFRNTTRMLTMHRVF